MNIYIPPLRLHKSQTATSSWFLSFLNSLSFRFHEKLEIYTGIKIFHHVHVPNFTHVKVQIDDEIEWRALLRHVET